MSVDKSSTQPENKARSSMFRCRQTAAAAASPHHHGALPPSPASLFNRFSAKLSQCLIIQNLSISSGFLPGIRPAMSPHLHTGE
ncbi:hypothetical protein B296_00047965 [Ensete ventricosum]|uniref:Uncharacterized protein n=1 Tax=Ensete ventricosum TaxID=4639 RepID=A0A426XB14_ENSVE|nr:hypothetical protein B296_00047965 [Ensete ventricosum]